MCKVYVTNKILTVLLLQSILCTCYFHVIPESRHGPLNGGHIAKLGKFPYIVALLNNNFEVCTGTILGPKHVLSEAWCLKNIPIDEIQIVANCVDYYSIHCKIYNIKHVSYHPNYTDIGVNDVAIIKIRNVFAKSYLIKTIPIRKHFTRGDETAIAVGWDPWSSEMRWNDVKVLSSEECDLVWGWKSYDPVICTETADLVRKGDFGVALILNDALLGIAVESGESYDVYQHVQEYNDWISSEIRKYN